MELTGCKLLFHKINLGIKECILEHFLRQNAVHVLWFYPKVSDVLKIIVHYVSKVNIRVVEHQTQSAAEFWGDISLCLSRYNVSVKMLSGTDIWNLIDLMWIALSSVKLKAILQKTGFSFCHHQHRSTQFGHISHCVVRFDLLWLRLLFYQEERISYFD